MSLPWLSPHQASGVLCWLQVPEVLEVLDLGDLGTLGTPTRVSLAFTTGMLFVVSCFLDF